MFKVILMIIFLIAISASGLLYFSGKGTSQISSFSDYFWIPLPFALLAFVFLVLNKSKV